MNEYVVVVKKTYINVPARYLCLFLIYRIPSTFLAQIVQRGDATIAVAAITEL